MIVSFIEKTLFSKYLKFSKENFIGSIFILFLSFFFDISVCVIWIEMWWVCCFCIFPQCSFLIVYLAHTLQMKIFSSGYSSVSLFLTTLFSCENSQLPLGYFSISSIISVRFFLLPYMMALSLLFYMWVLQDNVPLPFFLSSGKCVFIMFIPSLP